MTGFFFTSHPGYVAAIKLCNLVYLQRESPAKQTRENIPVITCNITANKKRQPWNSAETLPHAFCDTRSNPCRICHVRGGKGKLSVCLSEFMTGDCYLQSQDGSPADVIHCSLCVCVFVITRYWVFSPLPKPAEHRNGSSAQEWGNV